MKVYIFSEFPIEVSRMNEFEQELDADGDDTKEAHEDNNEDYTEWLHWPDEKPKKNNKERLISIIKHLGTIQSEIKELNYRYEELTENLYRQHRHSINDLISQNSKIEEELIRLQSKESKDILFKISVIALLVLILFV